MGELHIEPAQEKDIPGMLALWKDTPGLGWGAGDDEESLAAFMQKNPQTCLVLKEGNSVWGTVLGGFDGRRGYIYHLVVDKDFRRQSYGKKLLQEVVGDLAMNIWPGTNFPIFAENPEEIAASWDMLIKRGAQIFYPSHGKRIEVSSLHGIKD
jgi:GNAT superfamily N-acetyltransferase